MSTIRAVTNQPSAAVSKIAVIRNLVWFSFVTAAIQLLADSFRAGLGADQRLMLVQCLLGMAVVHLPAAISRIFRVEVPNGLHIGFLVFLFAAIYLGEVQNFYSLVPHWDDLLHGSSSIMCGLMGYEMFRKRNPQTVISPLSAAVITVGIALSVGTLWEIYEFTADGMLGLNMQKFMLADGTLLIGHQALADTMKDLFVDTAGAVLAGIASYTRCRQFTITLPGVHDDVTHETYTGIIKPAHTGIERSEAYGVPFPNRIGPPADE